MGSSPFLVLGTSCLFGEPALGERGGPLGDLVGLFSGLELQACSLLLSKTLSLLTQHLPCRCLLSHSGFDKRPARLRCVCICVFVSKTLKNPTLPGIQHWTRSTDWDAGLVELMVNKETDTAKTLSVRAGAVVQPVKLLPVPPATHTTTDSSPGQSYF